MGRTQGAARGALEQNTLGSLLDGWLWDEKLFKKSLILSKNKSNCDGSMDYCGSWIHEELKLCMEPLFDYKDSGQPDFMASVVTPGDGGPGLADRPETEAMCQYPPGL